jgi:hypothetical protein
MENKGKTREKQRRNEFCAVHVFISLGTDIVVDVNIYINPCGLNSHLNICGSTQPRSRHAIRTVPRTYETFHGYNKNLLYIHLIHQFFFHFNLSALLSSKFLVSPF